MNKIAATAYGLCYSRDMSASSVFRAFGLASLFWLAACGGPKRPASVWDSYDTRHPLSQTYQVPDGYARQYDGVIDNDAYYSAPSCTIMDSPACGE